MLVNLWRQIYLLKFVTVTWLCTDIKCFGVKYNNKSFWKKVTHYKKHWTYLDSLVLNIIRS